MKADIVSGDFPMTIWRKAIPESRDCLQSALIAWGIGALLAFACIAPVVAAWKLALPLDPITFPLVFSGVFAVLSLSLRAATLSGAFMGSMVCFILSLSPDIVTRFSPLPLHRPALPALVALVALTSIATRFGRTQKELRGVAEKRQGRRASQVAANLGVAALFAALGRYEGVIAALAEATADTLSSEIGQAIAGPAIIFPTLQAAPPGTDGAISLAGSAAGTVGATLIVAAGSLRHALWPNEASVMFAACAGLFFDSLLGSTLERRGWIGNDVVNLLSTLFASCLAEGLKR